MDGEGFKEAFGEEARDLLNQVESQTLALENNPEDPDVLSSLFRTFHTIKGSAGMFGFEPISHFAHRVENLLDLLRERVFVADDQTINLVLRARDHILAMLDNETGLEAETRLLQEEVEGLVALRGGQPLDRKQGTGSQEENFPGQSRLFRIHFSPSAQTYGRNISWDQLFGSLKELGDCLILPYWDKLPSLADLDVAQCYLAWEILLNSPQDENAILDQFFFVEEGDVFQLKELDPHYLEGDKRVGEILLEAGWINAETLAEALSEKKRLGQVLVEGHGLSPSKIRSALRAQEEMKTIQKNRESQKQEGHASDTSIRVASDKLDYLLNLVGELVTLQARFSVESTRTGMETFQGLSEQLERLTEELRDSSMKLRMLPVGESFQRLHRLVRDLSRELGKDVNLVLEGAETELDKNLLEKLKDPLVHLLRNAIDHGLESPEERLRNHKDIRGTLRVRAEQSGDAVILEIQDDGKGLDTGAILAKAREKGLCAADFEAPESQIHDFIFHPGFSTAASVTQVSGRGVGMDVVKRAIEEIGGQIGLSSQKGQGTTIRLRLPLTLAIIDGLMVSLDQGRYILPLGEVESCLEASEQELGGGRDRSLLFHGGTMIPLINLREFYGLEEAPKGVRPQIVVVRLDEGLLGLTVDAVLGGNQTVIKGLGPLLRKTPGLGGASILGDGGIALILDTRKIMEFQKSREMTGVLSL